MEELIKRLERVIQTGAPDKDGQHPISAEVVLEVVKSQLSTNLAEVGTDCISRHAAIDALDKRFDSIPIEQTTEILLLRKDLRDLPAAEPQRIKGKWALQSDDYHEYYECDQCGIAVGIDDIRNFCPNCGAEMREVTT
jgi:hypothetical protein